MHDDYLPNDPNRGIPIRDLIKKHGKLNKVVEKTEWFDETAKPRPKPKKEETE